MKPDTSRDEDAARDYARIAGASEDVGGGVGDQSPNPLLARSLGPDPWEPWTCQRCGSVNTAGMPEKCDGCGLRNFGVER